MDPGVAMLGDRAAVGTMARALTRRWAGGEANGQPFAARYERVTPMLPEHGCPEQSTTVPSRPSVSGRRLRGHLAKGLRARAC